MISEILNKFFTGAEVIDDLLLFVSIVECGSFAKAAECYDIYPSKISRRLQMLEEELGKILVDRTVKNRVVLTEAGLIIYEQFHGSLAKLNNKIQQISDLFEHKKFGGLRVILPPIFSNEFILPKLNRFTHKYPQLQLNIIYSTHDVSLLDGNFNLALTSIIPRRGDYKIRTCCSAGAGLFASKEYLDHNGTLETLEDLEKHKIILPILDGQVFDRWVLWDDNNTSHNLFIENSALIYDSAIAGINLVKNHFGISPLLNFNVQELVDAGLVQRVLPQYFFKPMPFYLIKPNEPENENMQLIEFFLNEILKSEY